MPIVTGCRNGEVVNVAHGSRESGVRNPVVMEPRPELQRMPEGERISVSGGSLCTGLDLLLEAELRRERDLPGEILQEARNRIQSLAVQCWCGEEKQRRS